MKKMAAFIDNILLLIILLSIVQIVMGDLTIIQGWFTVNNERQQYDKWMIIAGFAFDFIFSIEFVVRSVQAIKTRSFKKYFFYKRGWIDFLASLPLLLLTSAGPFISLALTGTIVSAERAVAGAIKLVKVVRVARILRLLRTLKIFGKIENVSSRMSQHHVSTVASLIVTVSIAVYMAFSYLDILHFADPVNNARVSLMFTMMLIADILFLAFFYSRHFAQNVSDPIYVIKRGMTENRYNYTAKIKDAYRDDEVFELARAYNTVWLPMKVRIQKLRDEKAAQAAMPDTEDDYSDLL